MDLRTVLSGARAIVFDVGETLVDESRAWTAAAVAAGTTPFTLMAALGAVIDRGEDHRRVWGLLGLEAPPPAAIDGADLYADALVCLTACRHAGLVIGIAGNQPAGAVAGLSAAGIDADVVGSSAEWGVAKPDPRFFGRLLEQLDLPADAIVHVGDRVDNDVLPSREAGMRTVLLRRGPWGVLHATKPEAALADARIDSLGELAEALAPPAGAGERRPVA